MDIIPPVKRLCVL